MSDHARESVSVPVPVASTRVGRTDLGPGSAFVEDGAMVVMVRGPRGERPVRIPLALVDDTALAPAGTDLAVTLRDATRIVLTTPAARTFHHDLLDHCRALPELTRGLRTFGSRRGYRATRPSAGADQQRFFTPLLQARRAGMTADSPAAVVGSFDTGVLAAACGDALRAFAAERCPEPGPERRALEAELDELVEPLMSALETLGQAAAPAAAMPDDLRCWRAWARELAHTFEAADQAWVSLDAALDEAPPPPPARP